MAISLDSDIYEWLISMGVIKTLASKKLFHSNQYVLDDKTSSQFLNGIKFAEILRKLPNPPSEEQLNKMTDSNASYSIMKNWEILDEEFKAAGIAIPFRIKSQLISGKSDAYNTFLKDIHRAPVFSSNDSLTFISEKTKVVIYFLSFKLFQEHDSSKKK